MKSKLPEVVISDLSSWLMSVQAAGEPAGTQTKTNENRSLRTKSSALHLKRCLTDDGING